MGRYRKAKRVGKFKITKMKKYLFVISIFTALIATSSLFAQVKNDTVRNETILKMTKAKLGDKIILSKISSSPNKFDISTDALIKLKENNVSDTVVNLMVYKQSLIESYSDKNSSANSDGSNYTFKNSGIYFKKNNKYTTLDPTLVTSSSAQMGLVSSTNMAQIEGGEANYQFTETPEFYFNFSPEKKDLNKSNANNTDNYMDVILNSGTAVSPNEFKLVKLKVGKGKREYQSGKTGGVYGGKTDYSIGDKYIVTFKYEKISDNTYKIILPNGLAPGEYCFVYLSNNANNNPYFVALGQNKNKVFDFGIK
jgi:hypothetical protein